MNIYTHAYEFNYLYIYTYYVCIDITYSYVDVLYMNKQTAAVPISEEEIMAARLEIERLVETVVHYLYTFKSIFFLPLSFPWLHAHSCILLYTLNHFLTHPLNLPPWGFPSFSLALSLSLSLSLFLYRLLAFSVLLTYTHSRSLARSFALSPWLFSRMRTRSVSCSFFRTSTRRGCTNSKYYVYTYIYI